MPKSKSKRGKPHRPIRPRVLMMSEQQYSNIADWINRITLLAEVTLPAGKCTLHDMQSIEDLFNWTNGLLYQRYKNLDQAELEDVVPVIRKGRAALNTIFDREISGKTTGYVATGDELKAIHEAFLIITPLLKEAVKLAPLKTLNEYLWADKTAHRRFMEEQHKKQKETNNGISK